MSPNVLRWLQELDRQGGEAPEGFDYSKAMSEVKKIQPEIEKILNVSLRLQWEQDMACFATLGISSEIYRDPVSGHNTQHTLICIRFCTFGRMVVVDGREIDKWELALTKLYEFLEGESYAVVDRQILEEPYAGDEKWPGAQKWTWFTRFFDYL